jgi:hypothetical protein
MQSNIEIITRHQCRTTTAPAFSLSRLAGHATKNEDDEKTQPITTKMPHSNDCEGYHNNSLLEIIR